MSQPPLPPPPPPPGGGLNQSAPLVSVSGGPPPPRGITDHPLAAAPGNTTSAPPLTTPTTNYLRTPTVGSAPSAPQQPQTFLPATPKVFASPPPPINASLDSMADAFLSADGTMQNPKLRPLPLPTTDTEMDRVRALVVRRAWGDVLSLIHTMLRGPSSHYTPIYTALLQGKTEAVESLDSLRDDVVELMLLQCHAWLKMRRYMELGHELRQWKFLEQPPSWIPPSVRIIAAAAWQYVPPDLGGGPQKATDSLYALRSAYQGNAAESVTVEYHLANVLCRQKSWRMALQALDRLADRIPEVTKAYAEKHYMDNVSATQPVLQAVVQCEVWSRQGRIFLQTGALEAAAALFENAKQLWQSTTEKFPQGMAEHPWVARQIPAQVLHTNPGMLSFSYRRYEQASEDFRKALNVLNQTWSVDGSYRREDWVASWGLLPPQHKETLYAETMNNLSIAALYSLRLHDGIQVLESLIRTDPTSFLSERMALNLCTMYELSADTAVANRKKRTLQLIAKRFFLHDVGPESFRIGP